MKYEALETLSEPDKQNMLKKLKDTSVILIDPLPSFKNEILIPGERSEELLRYAPEFVLDLRSQLLFDANKVVDAMQKDNYGLHMIAPSRAGVKPQFAIACGALGGFGGFFRQGVTRARLLPGQAQLPELYS